MVDSIEEIFEPQLFYFHAMCLYTRLNCMSLHKTDQILTVSPLPTLSCLLYRKVLSLMNALEGECFLLSRNHYKCKQVACSVVDVCFYQFFFILFTLLLVVYYLIHLFYTEVVAIFLFIH